MFNRAAIRKNALPCLLLVGLAALGPATAYARTCLYDVIELLKTLRMTLHYVSPGILICQVGVATTWMVRGNGRPWTRITTGLLALIVIWVMSAVETRLTYSYMLVDAPGRYAIALAHILFQSLLYIPVLSATLLLLIGIVCTAVWKLRRQGSLAQGITGAAPEQWQFSIRSLFALTAIVAILLSTGRAFFSDADWNAALRVFSPLDIAYLFALSLVRMLPTLPILFVALSPRRARTIVMTWLFSAILFIAGMFVFLKILRGTVILDHWLIEVLPEIVHLSLFATSLYILRRAGWLRVSQQTNMAPLENASATPLPTSG